ncbi:MAG: hypothetical protein IT439_03180 [Phycisphaerales bacterium]|nr:hypothetical protein [Phycisphaerales bacterium]
MNSSTFAIAEAALFLALGAPAAAQDAGGLGEPPEGAFASVEDAASEEAGPNTGFDRPATREPSATASPAEDAPVNGGRFHFSFGLDWTNAYYFRGIRQEDEGLILQPWAAVNIDVASGEGWSFGLTGSTWSSLHEEHTGADTDDDWLESWYEADSLLGATLTFGHWSFAAQYAWYASPNGAFETTEEVLLTAGYDDVDCLGAWALHPSATLAIETGSAAADGGDTGVFLQLGVTPGFSRPFGTAGEVSFSFPVAAGLSLGDYYEVDGDDDTFGFLVFGGRVAIPLPFAPTWGAWTLTAGVNGMLLGDHASEFNDDDEFEVLAVVGISVAY